MGDVPESPQAPPQVSPETLKQQLSDLIRDNVCLDVDREKVYQYAEARKAELYYRGKQYLYPVFANGNVADWRSASGNLESRNGSAQGYENDYSLNIIRGDGNKFIAVLGQRGPNVKAEAALPDDEQSVGLSRTADTAAAYLRNQWSCEAVQRELALSIWKNGTTFAYTPYVANGDKYGIHEEPEIDFVDTDMGDGETMPVPQVTGTTAYEKGCVELHLATIFEVTVPFYSKTLRDAPWLWYEYEEHRGKLLRAFPELRKKMGSNGEWSGDETGTSAAGRLSRDTASSPTGAYIAPRRNRWLYQRFWLRPEMYELLTSESVRTALETKFPDGVRVTMVQGEVVDLAHEVLDDVWAMCKPGVSEYMFADPVCADYMGIQDLVNDMYNLTIETMERSIPYSIVDPQLLDLQALSNRQGYPAEMIPAKPGVGARLSDGIFKAPVAEVDPQVIQFMNSTHETGRELVGILPAIFGGGSGDQTAREAEIRRNQALQQLNTCWNEMRDFWSAVFTNGVRQLAKYSLPDAKNLGGYVGEAPDFSILADSQDWWSFTTEEAMPMTWGQKRDLAMFTLQQGPEAWKIFGLEHPLNSSELADVLGWQGWKIPYSDARTKSLGVIKRLLEAQPSPAPDGSTNLIPSIPPDEFEDNHLFVGSVVREWAQTDQAIRARDANPAGYANVIAWGKAHLQLSGQGSGAPPPGGPPGGGSGPAPGGPGPSQGPGGPQVPITPSTPNGPSGAALPAPPGSQIGPPPQSGPIGTPLMRGQGQ